MENSDPAPPAKKETVFLASYPFMLISVMAGLAAVTLFAWIVMKLTGALWWMYYSLISHIPQLIAYSIIGGVYLTWAYRIRVTEDGVHGGTFWSTPVFMSWAEMEDVEPKAYVGWRYFRIRSFRPSCPPMWMPRFLAKPEEFRAAIAQHTSPLHPLRRSLENGGTGETREKLAA
jgi:hypothetical protein